jgi:type IX secretion system PorP/SprF family membrane protein
MMKKTITSCLLTLSGMVAMAQQDAQFSQNMFGKLDYNPGYAGMSKAYCGSLIWRDQWQGFTPGYNPVTYLFNADAYLPQIGGGLGLTVFQDQLGFEKTLEAKLSYSYHIVIGNGVLGVGPDIGYFQKSLNGPWLAPDGTNGASDPLIPVGGASKATYDLGLGAYYATPQGLYVGLSTSHLSAQTLQSNVKLYDYDVARHYYVMAGYTYNASPTWDIKPDLYIESDASSTQFQLDCLAEYNKLIWFGVGYRLNDAAIAFIGINYGFKDGSNLKIGFSYDYTLSEINNYDNGSYEIMVNYCFMPKPKVKVNMHSNDRFLN